MMSCVCSHLHASVALEIFPVISETIINSFFEFLSLNKLPVNSAGGHRLLADLHWLTIWLHLVVKPSPTGPPAAVGMSDFNAREIEMPGYLKRYLLICSMWACKNTEELNYKYIQYEWLRINQYRVPDCGQWLQLSSHKSIRHWFPVNSQASSTSGSLFSRGNSSSLSKLQRFRIIQGYKIIY